MATQFENGLTLSQLAERNAELVTEVEKLRAERDASLNAERVWEKTMMEVCGEDGPASVVAVIKALAAENVALKSNLMFWDADNPELPYDSPEEIASECSLNYNEEFVAQVAAKLPNRTYRVYESWESDCKLELVEGADLKTPATDAYLAGIKADAITASLDACSDYLETDCVMDRLDISYEEAEKRTSGAIEFHDAMVNFANQLREGADK